MTATSRLAAGWLCVALLASCQARQGARNPMPIATPGETARVDLATLRSDAWRLVAWASDEPAAPNPPVTLRYAGGNLSGRSGCNRYTAPVEQRPGHAIAVGAIAVTRMMCPPPLDALERRFLGLLARARALELRDDVLGLVTTDEDGRSVTLRFAPDAHPAD